jgi:hypothetical protein
VRQLREVDPLAAGHLFVTARDRERQRVEFLPLPGVGHPGRNLGQREGGMQLALHDGSRACGPGVFQDHRLLLR